MCLQFISIMYKKVFYNDRDRYAASYVLQSKVHPAYAKRVGSWIKTYRRQNQSRRNELLFKTYRLSKLNASY